MQRSVRTRFATLIDYSLVRRDCQLARELRRILQPAIMGEVAKEFHET